ARLHLLRGEAATAREYAERGVKTQPNSLPARLTLVRSLIPRSEDRPRAEKELKSLANRFPKSSEVYDAYATLALTQRDFAGARRAWDRALQLNPDDNDALSGITGLLVGAKKPAEARAMLNQRLAQNPKSSDLLLLSATLHLIQNEGAAAEAQLKQVLQLQ